MTTAAMPSEALVRVRPIPKSTPRRLHVVPSRPTVPPIGFVQGQLSVDFDPEDEDAYFGPQATSTPELPEARAWVAQMAQAIIETSAGLRPPAQLLRWVAPEVHAAVARRAAVASRRGAPRGRRAVIRSVHLCEPVDGVVEACAVVLDAGRVRAMALRLSGVDHRWLVTALQLG